MATPRSPRHDGTHAGDPLARALGDDAQRLADGPSRDLAPTVMAAIATRRRVAATHREAAPGPAPAARRPTTRPGIVAVPLALAAALLLMLRLGSVAGPGDEPAPAKGGQFAATAAASAAPFADDHRGWVAVTPPPPAPRSPAVEAPPRGPGGGLSLEPLWREAPRSPLRAIDRAIQVELQQATESVADSAGQLARHLWDQAVGPLAKLTGALGSRGVPR